MRIVNYELNQITYNNEAEIRAKALFNRVKTGQDEDYRTPFWNKAPRITVLNKWANILNYLLFKDRSPVPGLRGFEFDMLDKVGPLSVMLPLNERMNDIKSYYDMIKLKSEPILPGAIKRFLEKIANVKASPLGYHDTLDTMRLSTSAGIPFFVKKRKVVWEVISVLHKMEWYIAVLGWRGQEGGPDVEDVKQRVVWMFPFAVNIRELSVYTPLIKMWQQLHINSAYESMRAVELKLTKCFDSKGDDYVICTDFSKFDQHFNHHLQEAAFNCLDSMLPGSKGKEWLREVFGIKYKIPIAISDNTLITGKHGMGSGSGGTNFDECCAHSCLQEEAALLAGVDLNPYSNAYGDDGYLTYPGIDVDHVINVYTKHGQEMNVSKQFVSKNSAVYLRRYFHQTYRDQQGVMLGIYSTFRALGRLMGQERHYNFEDEVDYRTYLILRAWSIIENCTNHPYFEEFVDFVIEGDKYKLGLAVPGFLEGFDNDFNKLRELDPDVLGFVKSQQQENTGVRNWRVYKYLKSKL